MDNNKVIPVKVALRIRPLVPREKAEACNECIKTIPGIQQVILGKDKNFSFDYVFAQTSPQVEIYETAVQPLLAHLFKGYNATVLAYGQTGSGKTHTMGSGYASLSVAATAGLHDDPSSITTLTHIQDFDNVGVIPRVLNDLFARIDEESSKTIGAKFSVKVSFVEIYNEDIKDLFAERTPGVPIEPLNIREENNTIRVVNLSELTVKNATETIRLLEKGSSLRMVGGTAMNEESSRSHAIFTITLEQSSADNDVMKSKLQLVDLAGSERQSKTKAEGIRLKEGININMGLLSLGNVISVLGEDNPTNRPKHVPYRESKLTRLLQDSLGGNSHTIMIACVSPADSNMEESLNTLRYADRARKIKNKPILNIDPQAAELVNLRQQVQELKACIFRITGDTNYTSDGVITGANSNTNEATGVLKDENDRLKRENKKLLIELDRLINTSRNTYERMLQLETERDELSKKFDEIKVTFEKMSKSEMLMMPGPGGLGGPDVMMNSHEVSEDVEANNERSQEQQATALFLRNKSSEKLQLMNELQSKLGEFEQMKEAREQQTNLIGAESDSALGTDSNEPVDTEHTLKMAGMQHQLNEYNTELMKKQQVFQKMLENSTNKHESQHSINVETELASLKSKIELLEREKDELLKTKNVAEQKRDRIKQIESEYNELKKKEKEFKHVAKMKEENDKLCERLRNDIQHIKSERVRLIKQIKEESAAHRRYRTDKEKEVTQLKALERKRMAEISKLQEGNNKQENVLRRKNEEISRIQRQLRETSEKQKQVQEKRQQAFDKKDTSIQAEKLRAWITQEIEFSVGIQEAQANLNKLIQERREAAAELQALKREYEEYAEDYGGTTYGIKRNKVAHSMDATYVSNNKDEESESRRLYKNELDLKIKRIEDDIECKNVQINEIQQMMLESDGKSEEEKAQHILKKPHGIGEAKILLKHVYSSSVQYLLDSKLKQIQYETTINVNPSPSIHKIKGLTQELKEAKKKIETLNSDLNRTKKLNNDEISNLTFHYEQRIFDLIRTSALSDPNCSTDERYETLFEYIQDLSRRHEKKNDVLVCPTTITITSSSKSHFPKRLNGELKGDETYRRSVKRIQRDHRKTHVIRPEDTLAARAEIPAFDAKPVLSNIINDSSLFRSPTSSLKPRRNGTAAFTASTQYLSPFPNTSDAESSVVETPLDDKNKDPDWDPKAIIDEADGEKDWTKTPIGGLGKRRSKILNKSKNMNKTRSKSSLKQPELEALSDNEEN